MGLLDKFIKVTESEEVTQNATVSAPTPAPPVNAATQTYAAPQPVAMPAPDGPSSNVSAAPATDNVGANMELVKSLYQDLIDEKSISGSYLELKKNAEALSSMGLNPQQRFQAALKIMQSSNPNVKKEDMLSSIESYIAKIEEIRSVGAAQCEERHSNIDKDFAQFTQYANTIIANKQNKIAELQAEIDTLNTEIATQAAEVKQREDKTVVEKQNLDQERRVFDASVDFVKKSLNADKLIISAIQ